MFAGEYIKLQDAFVSELNQFVGQFKVIGYNMNDGAVFHYSDQVVNTANGTSVISPNGTALIAWKATAQVALNDCDQNSEWGLFQQQAGNGNGLKWTVGLTDGGTLASGTVDLDCSVLTPSFKSLETQN